MKAIEKPQAFIYTALFILLALITLILALSGCMSERVEGNRDLMTEERTSLPFSEIVSQGSFNVTIIPSTETYVVVKAESNILPYLYTRSDGTTITVGYKNGYYIHEHYPVEIFLYTSEVRSIRLSGSGLVEYNGFHSADVNLQLSGSGSISADFVSERLEASISGSGNINLKGSAKNTSLNVSGSGTLNTINLRQENCTASISGSGNIKTFAAKTLDAHITGSGSVYYKGNPAISSHITGSGKVQPY